jgi:hypothetical protein
LICCLCRHLQPHPRSKDPRVNNALTLLLVSGHEDPLSLSNGGSDLVSLRTTFTPIHPSTGVREGCIPARARTWTIPSPIPITRTRCSHAHTHTHTVILTRPVDWSQLHPPIPSIPSSLSHRPPSNNGTHRQRPLPPPVGRRHRLSHTLPVHIQPPHDHERKVAQRPLCPVRRSR